MKMIINLESQVWHTFHLYYVPEYSIVAINCQQLLAADDNKNQQREQNLSRYFRLKHNLKGEHKNFNGWMFAEVRHLSEAKPSWVQQNYPAYLSWAKLSLVWFDHIDDKLVIFSYLSLILDMFLFCSILCGNQTKLS